MKALKVAIVTLAIAAGATSAMAGDDLETMTLDQIMTWQEQNLDG